MKTIYDCAKLQAVNGLIIRKYFSTLPSSNVTSRLGESFQEIERIRSFEVEYPDLKKEHPFTLKNRIMSLQEYGFLHDKITSITVKKYLTLTHLQIHTLKNLLFIEKNTDVYKHLHSYTELTNYEPNCEESNIVTLKLQLLRFLLKDELGMPDERLENRSDVLKRLKNKSIRIIRRNIHIAKNIIGLSSSRICRNPFVLWADPDNTLKVIDEIKEIGGVDIKLCMSLYPKIISGSFENISDIKQILKEYNFTNEAIRRCISIFTLSSESVKNRILDLEKEEFFPVCRQSPRVLMFVYYYNKIKLRLHLLKEININNTSMNTISSCGQKRFNRYYENGTSRHVGQDVVRYICSELECDKIELRHKLIGTPFWRFKPAIEITKNLKYLRQQGFNNLEIFKSVHILFFNRSKIREELSLLDKKEGLECCKENGLVKRELILPLVIYFIEKSYNFTDHTFFNQDQKTHSDILIPEFKGYSI